MKILSNADCYRMHIRMQVPAHIVAHSIQVCRVATLLVEQLAIEGVDLDGDLVRMSALLHDITKLSSMETGELHSQSGERYLSQNGLPRVGRVVAQHVRLDSYFASDTPDEAEVVNYSDKRVTHDRIVPLDHRLQDILTRYGTTPHKAERIGQLMKDTHRVEERIFGIVAIRPAQVGEMLPDRGLQEMLARYRALDGADPTVV